MRNPRSPLIMLGGKGFGARLLAPVDHRYGAVTTLTSLMLVGKGFRARGSQGALGHENLPVFASGLYFCA